ncbi:MAG TPA: V-type ATPase 116kDa subunit family protein [Candidatus Bilamarchaeum sp.]|nr:V-type ATPase 116kDa subunit family protein [Candidatus Bilamarchaeum sp.]
MFRPKKMKKVRLIVLKSQVGSLIKELHEAGVVDIRKARHEGLEEGRPLTYFDEVSAELLRLRSALALMESALGKKDSREARITSAKDALAEARGFAAEGRLRELNKEILSLGEKSKALEAREAAARKCSHFKGIDFSRLGSRSVGYRVGEVQASKVPRLREALEKMNCDIVSEEGRPAVLVLFEKKGQQKVDALLGDAGFSDIELPEGMTMPAETAAAVAKEREGTLQALAGRKKELAELSRANIGKAAGIVRSLELEAERAEISNRFAESRRTYVVEGWALEDEMGRLGPIAEKHKAVLEDAGYDPHHESPPTVLDNPGLVREFEWITKSYSLPKYHEIDPTIPYFIGLSIIYGMIVGDVGYGIISMALAYWIMNKYRKSELMRPIATIWFISGIPTIIWGIVFNEWMGLPLHELLNWIGSFFGVTVLAGPLYTGFHRVEELSMLILATLFVGMIHLAFGLVVGAINEWGHSKRHAFAKVGWLALETGIALGLLGALKYVDPSFTGAGMVVGAIGAVVVIATEGANGAVEIPGFAGNILSYSRIAVIGVVGVILAEILNEFLRPTPAMGLMAIVLLPVFLALHFANCIIAMFEALVQGGRLNIFEFRTKAIQGGGNVFSPFAAFTRKS